MFVVKKQNICHYNIIVNISKLLRKNDNQTFCISHNIVFDNLITSFIISIVVCIIDCNNIIKILSTFHASLLILSILFVVFVFLMLLILWILTLIIYSIWKISYFISFYFSFYQFLINFFFIYCTSNLQKYFYNKSFVIYFDVNF